MLKIMGVRISWRVVFQVVLGLVYASPALADWGESWGTLVWGSGVTAVPLLDWWGLYFLLIAVGLMGTYWARRARQGLAVSLLVIVVLIPLAVAAGTVTVPNPFVNGTAADANEVNANFDAVETAVNDNDSRITTAQATADAAAAGHTVDTNTQLSNAEVAAAATAEGFVTGPHTTVDQAAVDAFAANDGFGLASDIAVLEAQIAALQPRLRLVTPSSPDLRYRSLQR